MAPPPPPFYPEAEEKEESANNAISTAFNRLARILGLGKDQADSSSSEPAPSIPIGGPDQDSYVFLDKPDLKSPVRASTTERMHRHALRRSITTYLPEDEEMGIKEVPTVSRGLVFPYPPSLLRPKGDSRGSSAAPKNFTKGNYRTIILTVFAGLALIIATIFFLICLSCDRRRRAKAQAEEETLAEGSGEILATLDPSGHEGLELESMPVVVTAEDVEIGRVQASSPSPPPSYGNAGDGRKAGSRNCRLNDEGV
ncbi:hypothetical protein L873DRAFT_1808845 [Choiromyces venosus 120613-1]|uniref:Uncharacterized protein n=1 Tax=Choiromyces venosus 120613-1 TaxID=1336337 RepID=A0A3N4JNL8_9PEZI|nr:hypothetical protein L873DRAFT_1808845 [Choiromyces venosus 120613-1]